MSAAEPIFLGTRTIINRDGAWLVEHRDADGTLTRTEPIGNDLQLGFHLLGIPGAPAHGAPGAPSALTPERAARRLAVVREIKADCERDVEAMRARPFDATNVAEVLGELYGTLHGLAGVVESILDEGRPE